MKRLNWHLSLVLYYFQVFGVLCGPWLYGWMLYRWAIQGSKEDLDLFVMLATAGFSYLWIDSACNLMGMDRISKNYEKLYKQEVTNHRGTTEILNRYGLEVWELKTKLYGTSGMSPEEDRKYASMASQVSGPPGGVP